MTGAFVVDVGSSNSIAALVKTLGAERMPSVLVNNVRPISLSCAVLAALCDSEWVLGRPGCST